MGLMQELLLKIFGAKQLVQLFAPTPLQSRQVSLQNKHVVQGMTLHVLD